MTTAIDAANKAKPKKWRSRGTAHHTGIALSQSVAHDKARKQNKGPAAEGLEQTSKERSTHHRRPATHPSKRRPFVNVPTNAQASDSDGSQEYAWSEDEESRSKMRSSKPIATKSNKLDQANHRDRLRKHHRDAFPGKEKEGADHLHAPNADKQYREASFVTDGGAPSMASNDRIPRASSPLTAPAAKTQNDQKGQSKVDESTLGNDKSLNARSISDNSTSVSSNGGKVHRGIVAEMHAHERRQARLAGQANKQANNAASNLLNHLRASSQMPNAPPSEAMSAVPSPVSSSLFPYGLPTLPNGDAGLSPYGLSPYAEPGSSWTTNVYVNNLPPHTTDEDLLRLGSCFGRVKSHKAIINQETGLCKGYGFIMYEFLHDAELAIQQLPLHGLSTSWAKESFSSKLRRMADSTTSNVYLSNLPQDITPAQLEQLFLPHHVVSLRILTDPASGKSRGVGFVRLRDRISAQACIEHLNGITVPGQDSPLQARYADSEAQKQFKLCARAQLHKTEQPDNGDRESLHEANSPHNAISSTASATTAAHSAPPSASIFAAALQGQQHSWTGFATPASNTGGFSPLLGLVSPQAGVPGFAASGMPTSISPQVPFNQTFTFPSNYPQHHSPITAAFDNTLFGHQATHENFDPMLHRLQWLATSQQFRAQQQQMAPSSGHVASGNNGKPSSNVNLSSISGSERHESRNKLRATYLPPDLAMQHARALMEKNMQHESVPHAKPSGSISGPAEADATSLTQKHVETERAELLKMLKDTSDKMTRLHVSSASSAKVQEKKELVDGKGEEELVVVKQAQGQQEIHQHPSPTNSTPRRFSNPAGPMFDTVLGKAKEPPFESSTAMRPSVSAAALSPLRFMYSKDPKAPISVEAIDVTRTTDDAPASDTLLSLTTQGFDSDKRPTVLNKNQNEQLPSPATDCTSNTHDVHSSTIIEEEKENTTADSGDGAGESSYTTSNTTSILDDSVASGISMRKSDSGKDFTGCREDLFTTANANDDDVGCTDDASPLLVGIMAAVTAAAQQEQKEHKRTKSGAFSSNSPFSIASQHPN